MTSSNGISKDIITIILDTHIYKISFVIFCRNHLKFLDDGAVKLQIELNFKVLVTKLNI